MDYFAKKISSDNRSYVPQLNEISFEIDALCLGHNEIRILQRIDRAMEKTICGVILVDKKMKKDSADVRLERTIDKLAKANALFWHGHVFKKNIIFRISEDFKPRGTRKSGRTSRTCLQILEEGSGKVGLKESDARYRSKWRLEVNAISRR